MNSMHVIFRTCKFISNKYTFHQLSKIETLQLTLESLLESIKTSSFSIERLDIVLDGTLDVDFSLLTSKFGINPNIISSDQSGNYASFQKVLQVAASSSSDFIYICEDDYFYDLQCFSDVSRALPHLEELKFWFLSPYWHGNYDVYKKNWLGRQCQTIVTSENRFTSVPTTTLTFLAPKQSILRFLHYFQLFSFGVPDYYIWKLITGTKQSYSFYEIFPWSVFVRLQYLKFFMRLPKRSKPDECAVLVAPEVNLAQHICKYETIQELKSEVSRKRISELLTESGV